MTDQLRIVVADDHPLYRDGVVGTLRASGLDVVGEAAIARDAVRLVGELTPDLALFDVDMIQKDMRLALDMARASGVVLPSVALTHELLTAAKGLGLARYDFAVLFDVVANLSGLPPWKKL